MREILKILGVDVSDAIPEELPKATAESVWQNGLNWVFIGLGIIGVVMLIYGGIQFILSQGDAGKAQKARQTIIYSVIGIIVVMTAFVVVNFVLGAF